jgi:hypothetical protein
MKGGRDQKPISHGEISPQVHLPNNTRDSATVPLAERLFYSPGTKRGGWRRHQYCYNLCSFGHSISAPNPIDFENKKRVKSEASDEANCRRYIIVSRDCRSSSGSRRCAAGTASSECASELLSCHGAN